jgi:hypothetical protein
MPVAFSMSMSFSMSMDLRFGDLTAAMQDIEDTVREFGREPVVMDKIGIRGSRIPQTRPRNTGKIRLLSSEETPSSNVEVECDDYPCVFAATPEEASKTGEGDEMSDKSTKSGKDSKAGKDSKSRKDGIQKRHQQTSERARGGATTFAAF